MQMIPYGRKGKRTKEPLENEEESENVGLKFNIQKTKILAFSSITSWQIEGGKVLSLFSDRFYFFGFQNHCRW